MRFKNLASSIVLSEMQTMTWLSHNNRSGMFDYRMYCRWLIYFQLLKNNFQQETINNSVGYALVYGKTLLPNYCRVTLQIVIVTRKHSSYYVFVQQKPFRIINGPPKNSYSKRQFCKRKTHR